MSFIWHFHIIIINNCCVWLIKYHILILLMHAAFMTCPLPLTLACPTTCCAHQETLRYVKQSHDHTSRMLHQTQPTRSFSETKRECYRTNSWVWVISEPCGLSHMQLMPHRATNIMQPDCDKVLHKIHCTKLLSKNLSFAQTHRQWHAI
jgi:hypothetical protein